MAAEIAAIFVWMKIKEIYINGVKLIILFKSTQVQ